MGGGLAVRRSISPVVLLLGARPHARTVRTHRGHTHRTKTNPPLAKIPVYRTPDVMLLYYTTPN